MTPPSILIKFPPIAVVSQFVGQTIESATTDWQGQDVINLTRTLT
jgi:hypothetical protein